MGGHDPAALMKDGVDFAFEGWQEAPLVFNAFRDGEGEQSVCPFMVRLFVCSAVAFFQKQHVVFVLQFGRFGLHERGRPLDDFIRIGRIGEMVPFVTARDGIPDALRLVRQPVIDLPDFYRSGGRKTGIGEIGDFFSFRPA